MGVNVEFYTVLGVKTGRQKEFDEYVDEHDLFKYKQSTSGFIPDVITANPDYTEIFFGKVLFHDDTSDTDIDIEIDPTKFDEWEAEYRAEFAKNFPDLIHILPSEKFKLYSFVAYG